MTESTKVKEQVKIKDLAPIERREEIEKILKSYRDGLVVRIVSNTDLEEKIYSETDYCKLEIRMCNRLLSLPKQEVMIEREMTKEEVLAAKDDEIEIGDVDDLFTTQE